MMAIRGLAIRRGKVGALTDRHVFCLGSSRQTAIVMKPSVLQRLRTTQADRSRQADFQRLIICAAEGWPAGPKSVSVEEWKNPL